MDNPQVTDTVLATWVAAFLDGEGCLSIFPQRPGMRHPLPAIVVTNSDPRLVATMAEILTQWGIGHHVSTYPKKNRLPVVQLAVRGYKRCLPLLKKIRPFLVSKGEEADEMLRLIESRLSKPPVAPVTDEEMACIPRCKELKRVRHLRDFVPAPLYCRGEDKVHALDES